MILAVNCDPLIAASSYQRVVPLAKFPNADIWIFSSNNVVKSISVWYKYHHLP